MKEDGADDDDDDADVSSSIFFEFLLFFVFCGEGGKKWGGRIDGIVRWIQ